MGVSVSLSVALFWVLLASVGAGRLGELRLSRRHQRDLQARGARPVPEPRFRWMVALHTGVLVAAAAEAWLLHRPLIPALAAVALILVVLASLLRWWVIATLGAHWNVRVLASIGASTGLGVVTDGPFRWVRHPNYVAVFVELAALPLVHSAWLTAAIGAALHLVVLHRRIVLEESVLLADAAYRATMGPKPRFLPRPGRRPDAPPSQTWPTSTS